MIRAMRFSSKTVGLASAVVTVLIWTGFIVIARASASRGLLPLDIVLARILGASAVLLPWAWWLMRPARQVGEKVGSLWGLSPLPLRQTVQTGLLGGFLYAILAYTGFVYAPATHASVLMPGSLPLWTTLLAWLFLREKVSAGRAVGLGFIVLGDVLVGGASLLMAFDGGEVWKGDLLFMAAALCWSSYSVLVRHYGPVRSTMITALVPGLSALGAVWFLSEPMHWNLLAGLALVTSGILFGVRQAKKPVVAPISPPTGGQP